MDSFNMPFGKHEGIPIEEVPVPYLKYVWNEGLVSKKKYAKVFRYIYENDSIDVVKFSTDY